MGTTCTYVITPLVPNPCCALPASHSTCDSPAQPVGAPLLRHPGRCACSHLPGYGTDQIGKNIFNARPIDGVTLCTLKSKYFEQMHREQIPKTKNPCVDCPVHSQLFSMQKGGLAQKCLLTVAEGGLLSGRQVLGFSYLVGLWYLEIWMGSKRIKKRCRQKVMPKGPATPSAAHKIEMKVNIFQLSTMACKVLVHWLAERCLAPTLFLFSLRQERS